MQLYDFLVSQAALAGASSVAKVSLWRDVSHR